MGVVYLARDERLDRPVALKLIAPTLSVDPGFRERFLTESRLAASLDHSHVIPIYEAGEADGELYLAMRYVEGTTLRDLLHQAGPLEPARVLDLCEQVAEALDAAHARDLVHRDVKPGNVLIADEGGRDHCYLCDFGIAQQRRQSRMSRAASRERSPTTLPSRSAVRRSTVVRISTPSPASSANASPASRPSRAPPPRRPSLHTCTTRRRRSTSAGVTYPKLLTP